MVNNLTYQEPGAWAPADTKKTTPNMDVWPESLGAMLEYWYIERGLFLMNENISLLSFSVQNANSENLVIDL